LIPDRLGKRGLPAGRVSESWEVSDYRDTSATTINGAYAGQILHDLVERFPHELVGVGWDGPHFPLLEKFLDASHPLPVHLHADDETARRVHGEPHGKTEAWHILWAAEGATILAGVKEGLSRDDLFQAFREQRYDDVMPRMPVRQGDTVYVPGGVIHSFGPNTLIFEVQQTSDLGQFVTPDDLYGNRLPDLVWEKNIDAALDELRIDYHPRPNPGLTLEDGVNRRVIGCAGPHFALERWSLQGDLRRPQGLDRVVTLSNVGPPVDVEYGQGRLERLDRGESCVLPAALGDWKIAPQEPASLVACYVPNLEANVVEPLRAAGYSRGEIEALGEVFAE